MVQNPLGRSRKKRAPGKVGFPLKKDHARPAGLGRKIEQIFLKIDQCVAMARKHPGDNVLIESLYARTSDFYRQLAVLAKKF